MRNLPSSQSSVNSTLKSNNDLIVSRMKFSTGLSRTFKSHKKIYGKLHKSDKSIEDSGSKRNLDEPSTSGTQISFVANGNEKLLKSKDKEIILTQKLDSDQIYAIVLPLIICDGSKLRQPVLLLLRKSVFNDYEIDLPFSSFMDTKFNCFKFKVRNCSFHGVLIALGGEIIVFLMRFPPIFAIYVYCRISTRPEDITSRKRRYQGRMARTTKNDSNWNRRFSALSS